MNRYSDPYGIVHLQDEPPNTLSRRAIYVRCERVREYTLPTYALTMTLDAATCFVCLTTRKRRR